jgi:hypothetical protein
MEYTPFKVDGVVLRKSTMTSVVSSSSSTASSSTAHIEAHVNEQRAQRDRLTSRHAQLVRDVDELRWLLSAESEATTRLSTRCNALRTRIANLERARRSQLQTYAAEDDTGSSAAPAAADAAQIEVPSDVRSVFVEHCTRATAVQILQAKPALSFLLRRSSFDNAHALSYVDEEAKVLHCLVLRSDDGWSLEGETDEYQTLSALLEAYGFV